MNGQFIFGSSGGKAARMKKSSLVQQPLFDEDEII
jgi:hypothetical protein